MTLAEVLHSLVDKVHGWGTHPEMHDAIDEHFGSGQPQEAEPEPESGKSGKD